MKSLRCAGAEYLRLAAGETHFSLFTRLMPWDHVPGTLLHSEAGGIALCFDGTPYKATRWRETGLLMAPDRQSWDALHARSEEHTSELQSLMRISYAVFCLKKKNTNKNKYTHTSIIPQVTTLSIYR